jgi:prepilin-type N-terminal cleavage/methylation domain-containing protein
MEVRANPRPFIGARTGRTAGFTLIELLVVVAIIALLISILLPSLARARELSKRSVCQSNLKGMGTSFYTYGNEYSDMWPICPAVPASTDGTSPVTYVRGTGTTSFITTIGYKRGTASTPLSGDTVSTDNTMSTARNLWTLIRMQIAPPKSFNCPSDTDSEGNQDQTPQSFWDFGNFETNADVPAVGSGKNDSGYRQCSYGYQVPYTTKGKPSSDRDQRMVLAADRGPFSPLYESGKAWPTGIGFAPNPAGTANSKHLASSDDWKTWNSPNHGGFSNGEGQNVLYAGGSAEWQGKPCGGIGFDNIYTRWSAADGASNDSRTLGNPPGSYSPGGGGLVSPYSDTDSVIYP